MRSPQIMHEAGAPAGRVQPGDRRRRRRAARSSNIRTSTASRSPARRASAQASARPRSRQARVQLEMGGKNPLVVLDDADLDRAVACAIDGAFFATGQRCTASSRIIVTEGIHDRFVEALAERAQVAARSATRSIRTRQIGPAVSESQLEQNLQLRGDRHATRAAGLTGRRDADARQAAAITWRRR